MDTTGSDDLGFGTKLCVSGGVLVSFCTQELSDQEAYSAPPQSVCSLHTTLHTSCTRMGEPMPHASGVALRLGMHGPRLFQYGALYEAYNRYLGFSAVEAALHHRMSTGMPAIGSVVCVVGSLTWASHPRGAPSASKRKVVVLLPF